MAKRPSKQQDAEADVLASIAGMPEADRVVAERLHAVIRASAPNLVPRLWYGQPAYSRDGKVVVFFRGAAVDKERYLTLGFTGEATLDHGNVWPTAFAVTALTDEDEARIADLVKAAGR